VVLSGGGERVIAWQTGVLAGLADAGVDLRRAGAIIGTSAGAYVGARLAAGEDPRADARRIAARDPEPVAAPAVAGFEQLATVFEDAGTVAEGRRRIGAMALAAPTRSEEASIAPLAERLPASSWPESLRLVTVDAERGERVVLDARSGASLAAGVAAARAIPTVLPAITVDGRRLIDGAIGSPTNADLAGSAGPAIERVLVIAALPAGPGYEKLSRLWNEALRAELWELDAAGIETYMVRATTADLEVMGPDMMSGGAAPMAVRAGRRTGQCLGPALGAVMRPAVAA
jgi:NTE family protein